MKARKDRKSKQEQDNDGSVIGEGALSHKKNDVEMIDTEKKDENKKEEEKKEDETKKPEPEPEEQILKNPSRVLKA